MYVKLFQVEHEKHRYAYFIELELTISRKIRCNLMNYEKFVMFKLFWYIGIELTGWKGILILLEIEKYTVTLVSLE